MWSHKQSSVVSGNLSSPPPTSVAAFQALEVSADASIEQNKLDHEPEDCESCAIMNEIHPSFQSDPALPPQLLDGVSKRLRRPLVVALHVWAPAREKRLVKVPSQVPPIYIGHRPHRPDHASKAAELHGRSEMEHLVRDTLVRQLRSVASG